MICITLVLSAFPRKWRNGCFMPRWLSYLTLIPGLIIAIKLAFGWEEYSLENIGLSSILVFIGMVLMGISQAEALKPSEKSDDAKEVDINFALIRLMATALATLCLTSFSLYVVQNTSDSSNEDALFWFSLPFLFVLLTVKYYQVWRLKRFLYGNGRLAEGIILTVERQIHHRKGHAYFLVTFEFTTPESKTYRGETTCPYSPYVEYAADTPVSVLYDPAKPERNLLLSAWHGKGLQSGKEYYKKLARPDDRDK